MNWPSLHAQILSGALFYRTGCAFMNEAAVAIATLHKPLVLGDGQPNPGMPQGRSVTITGDFPLRNDSGFRCGCGHKGNFLEKGMFARMIAIPAGAASLGSDHTRTNRATMRRVIGATTKTAGKATAQLVIHDPNQWPGNSASTPKARHVAIPETMADIMPDRKKPKTMGANRAGIIYTFLMINVANWPKPISSWPKYLSAVICRLARPCNAPTAISLLRQFCRWDYREKRPPRPQAKPVGPGMHVMHAQIYQPVKRLAVNQGLQPRPHHHIW